MMLPDPKIVYRDGVPVCAECGEPFDHRSERTRKGMLNLDDEMICWGCLQEWAQDDFQNFMDFFSCGEHEIYSYKDIMEIVEDDDSRPESTYWENEFTEIEVNRRLEERFGV